jgi:hypothetical protein
VSKGLGRVERDVLRIVQASSAPYVSLAFVRETLCPTPQGDPEPTRHLNEARAIWAIRQWAQQVSVKARHEAIHRAVRSLTRKGLVQTGTDRYGRGHRKVLWLTERPAPDATLYRHNTYC